MAARLSIAVVFGWWLNRCIITADVTGALLLDDAWDSSALGTLLVSTPTLFLKVASRVLLMNWGDQ